jgi:hypothetical protein
LNYKFPTIESKFGNQITKSAINFSYFGAMGLTTKYTYIIRLFRKAKSVENLGCSGFSGNFVDQSFHLQEQTLIYESKPIDYKMHSYNIEYTAPNETHNAPDSATVIYINQPIHGFGAIYINVGIAIIMSVD